MTLSTKAARKAAQEAVDPLLSAEQAAQYLGVQGQTLAVWRCTGRYNLPFVKVGRLVRYRQSALDEFLSQNTATQTG